MIRARFKTYFNDPRPVHWPVKHPFWVTGQGMDENACYYTLVAYADDVDEILDNWPEADELDFTEETEYQYTDRFPKPDWME